MTATAVKKEVAPKRELTAQADAIAARRSALEGDLLAATAELRVAHDALLEGTGDASACATAQIKVSALTNALAALDTKIQPINAKLEQIGVAERREALVRYLGALIKKAYQQHEQENAARLKAAKVFSEVVGERRQAAAAFDATREKFRETMGILRSEHGELLDELIEELRGRGVKLEVMAWKRHAYSGSRPPLAQWIAADESFDDAGSFGAIVDSAS